MILVDSSVWIDHLRGRVSRPVAALRTIIGAEPLLVGDLILLEVLQGLRADREAAIVEAALRRFDVVSLLDPSLAVQAAAHFRFLRGRGITVRKTIELIIGAFCIANGHALLHDDREFMPMVTHLGLRSVIA